MKKDIFYITTNHEWDIGEAGFVTAEEFRAIAADFEAEGAHWIDEDGCLLYATEVSGYTPVIREIADFLDDDESKTLWTASLKDRNLTTMGEVVLKEIGAWEAVRK